MIEEVLIKHKEVIVKALAYCSASSDGKFSSMCLEAYDDIVMESRKSVVIIPEEEQE